MRKHVRLTPKLKLKRLKITVDKFGINKIPFIYKLAHVMKKLLIIVILFYGCAFTIFAQGDLNNQQKVFFRNERSFGLLLSSDGMGISYREAKRVDFLNKRFFEIEAGNLKHPREYKISNPLYQTPGTFVFGKLNTVFYIRGSYGHQRELFKKADLGGVAIRYFYEGGPVFALYKPIYYKILYPVSQYNFEIKEEKIDVNTHQPYDIYSKSSFTKGLGETKILPGLYAKAGFNFEYSREDKVIHAIEVGGQINGFPKKIPIMATTDNKAVFFSIFVSYRFGVVIDPLNPESNKFSYFFRRKRAPANY
jgi:hypothetical protein